MFRFLHAADFHLDSAFGALTPHQAAARRREGRELAFRLADYANSVDADALLLAGDLFENHDAFQETAEQLAEALGQTGALVFIAPGNHDHYGPTSPYQAVRWPDNVHIFKESSLTAVELPERNVVIHGAAFTAPEQRKSLLSGFRAAEDGAVHLALLHGELDGSEDRYDPITSEEAASSGLAYLALGHIHKTGQATCGRTLCAWPGCIEGRGFDELGEKGFYEGVIDDDGAVSLTFVPFARHRYWVMEADVTGKSLREVAASILQDLHTGAERDLCRLVLTGETGEEGLDLPRLKTALESRFYALEVQDHTRIGGDLWKRAEEDSLRGLFLRRLRQDWDRAESEEAREQITMAVRFGLAALEHRDLG